MKWNKVKTVAKYPQQWWNNSREKCHAPVSFFLYVSPWLVYSISVDDSKLFLNVSFLCQSTKTGKRKKKRAEKLGSISCLIELILMLVGWSNGNIWNFLIAFSGCSREEASLIIFMDGWSCCCGSIQLAFLFLFSRPGVFFRINC